MDVFDDDLPPPSALNPPPNTPENEYDVLPSRKNHHSEIFQFPSPTPNFTWKDYISVLSYHFLYTEYPYIISNVTQIHVTHDVLQYIIIFKIKNYYIYCVEISIPHKKGVLPQSHQIFGAPLQVGSSGVYYLIKFQLFTAIWKQIIPWLAVYGV